MVRPARILIILAILLIPAISFSAPLKPRPLAGIGLLRLTPLPLQNGPAVKSIVLYREPGIGRIIEMDISDLPSLLPALKGDTGEILLSVTRKHGEWVKVIYDDSGREGWLHMARHWQYQPWDTFLKGREVRLLNGLRKNFYQLHATPVAKAPSTGTLTRRESLRVVDVQDNWILVLVDLASSGWLRWRDDDGRLMISVE